MASGMDDFMAKPVDPEKIENMLKKWIHAYVPMS